MKLKLWCGLLALWVAVPSFGQAVTPAASGDADVARRILSGEWGRVAFLGDSLLQNSGSAPYLWLSRIGIRGYGAAGAWYSAGTQSGVFTATTATDDFNDFLQGGGRWAEINFSGGTSNASSSDTNNRMLELARLGPRSSSIDPVEAEWDSAAQGQFAFGYDWMTSRLAAGPLVVRFPYMKHPGGTTAANEYFVVRNNSTVIATSGYVSTYAAAVSYAWAEATIPQGGGPYSGLNVEVRFRASTASENGKKSYWSSRGEVVDPNASTGSLVHVFAQGGLNIDNFHDGVTWSDQAMKILALLTPDVYVINLGANDSSNGDAEDFAADAAALVARLRGFTPNAKIVFWSPYGRASVNPNFGGEGPEPYYVPGGYQAQQATTDSVFINSSRLLPNVTVLSGPYGSFQWGGIPAGRWIYRGSVVESSGNLYACRVSHARTGTAPAGDSANWALLSAYNVFNSREPKIYDLNPAFYDGLHPHLHGGQMFMQSFVDGLQIAAAQQSEANIAEAVETLLADELAALTAAIASAQPRVNIEPDPGFTRTVPTGAGGVSRVALPIPIPAGDVGEQAVALDMSQLYGRHNFVKNVGVATVSGSGVTAEGLGPRDWFAFVKVDGTIAEGAEHTVSVPVTMVSGATRTVTFLLRGVE